MTASYLPTGSSVRDMIDSFDAARRAVDLATGGNTARQIMEMSAAAEASRRAMETFAGGNTARQIIEMSAAAEASRRAMDTFAGGNTARQIMEMSAAAEAGRRAMETFAGGNTARKIMEMSAAAEASRRAMDTITGGDSVRKMMEIFGNADAARRAMDAVSISGTDAVRGMIETFGTTDAARRALAAYASDEPIRRTLEALGHAYPPSKQTKSQADKPTTDKPALAVKSVIITDKDKKVSEGVLVKSTSLVWASIVETLKDDWQQAFQISPRIWEEIIAGAFTKEGFDEVILTPPSNDHGRDVIAIRKGVGSIRILGSVKAYTPPHRITKEEVHALMGVVAIDPNASKGIFATTSDFAPKLLDDPRLADAIPYRIELMNGRQLQQWLRSLLDRKS